MSTVGAPGGIIGTGAPEVAGLMIMSVTLAAGSTAAPPNYFALVYLHQATLDRNLATSLNRGAGAAYFGCTNRFGGQTLGGLKRNIRTFDRDIA